MDPSPAELSATNADDLTAWGAGNPACCGQINRSAADIDHVQSSRKGRSAYGTRGATELAD